MENFIRSYQLDTKLCDDLVKYFSKNKEYKNKGGCFSNGKLQVNKDIKDSIDVNFYNSSCNKTIQKYFKELSRIAQSYIDEFKLIDYNLRTSKSGSLIQFYPKGGGYKKWHFERFTIESSSRALVFMTYLNTIKDGGETEFLYQKIKFKPKKGLSLIWPTDFTHTHRGIPSPTEEKMIVTGWLNFIT